MRFKVYFSIVFQNKAAIIPPVNGVTINSQSWENANPPAKTAGPKLLAGFTEVPVMVIATRWINRRFKPIASLTIVVFPHFEDVANMTNKKYKGKNGLSNKSRAGVEFVLIIFSPSIRTKSKFTHFKSRHAI